jgi:hypothetical protein
MAKPILDSTVIELHGKVELLQAENASIRAGFSELIGIEKEKNRELSGKFEDQKGITVSTSEENKYLKKKVNKVKWQRNGLGVLLAVVIAVSL